MVSPMQNSIYYVKGLILVILIAFVQFGLSHTGKHKLLNISDSLIKVYPDSAELYLDRGEWFRIHDDPVKANVDYQMVQILKPKWNVLNYCRAQLSMENNDWKRALEYLDKYIQISPKDVDGLILRGELQLKYGDKEGAEKDFKKAMYVHGKVPSMFYYQISTLYMNQKDYKPAMNWLVRGFDDVGESDALHSLAYEIELVQKNYKKALKRLELQFKNRENKVRYFLKRGHVLEKMGKGKEAMVSYQKGLGNMEIIPDTVSRSNDYANLKKSLSLGLRRLELELESY